MSDVLDALLPKPGTLLAGRYLLESELGRGGFGVVYKARQQGLDEPVAVKILLPHVVSKEQVKARFQREVAVAKRLRHPNTIRLLDVSQTEHGLPYYVMEYLSGRNLADVLYEEGALSRERTRKIGVQVLRSLSEAHSNGVVHRDLKPENLVLCEITGADDFVKVLDFGIAKALAADGTASNITQTDMVMGTPNYMSPEQCMGDKRIDHRSDIYTVGLILGECLSGNPVVAGDTLLRVMTVHASPKSLSFPASVTQSELWPIIEKATQKDPGQRFISAANMADQLDSLPALSGRVNTDRLFGRTLTSPPTPAPKGLQATIAEPRPTLSDSPTAIRVSQELSPPSESDNRRNRLVLLVLAILMAAGAAALALMMSGGDGESELVEAPGDGELPAPDQAEPEPEEDRQAAIDAAAEQAAQAEAERQALGTAVAIAIERSHGAFPAQREITFAGMDDVQVVLGELQLGTSPFALYVPEMDYSLGVVLNREGHEPREVTFSFLDREVDVALQPLQARTRRRETPPADTPEEPAEPQTDSSPFGTAPIDRSRPR